MILENGNAIITIKELDAYRESEKALKDKSIMITVRNKSVGLISWFNRDEDGTFKEDQKYLGESEAIHKIIDNHNSEMQKLKTEYKECIDGLEKKITKLRGDIIMIKQMNIFELLKFQYNNYKEKKKNRN